MKKLEANSIDALVTDPPAGISFMNKKWDDDKGGRDHWIAWMAEVMREALRVMKPGAHGLVWALPRTSHWTGMALEQAGFEVRDIISHLFGQGFPKSLDVSKAIDKTAGIERERVPRIRLGDKAAYAGEISNGLTLQKSSTDAGTTLGAPATDAAKQWQGWGTALKPAHETWILVRKPLSEKTVAANVLKHGTGGINIDGSRIPTEVDLGRKNKKGKNGWKNSSGGDNAYVGVPIEQQGRFPANTLFSCACEDEEHDPECAVGMLDAQSGDKCGAHGGSGGFDWSRSGINLKKQCRIDKPGGASRFFFVAKISSSERNAGCDKVLTWENQDQNLVEKMGELSQLVKDISGNTMPMLSGQSWSTDLYGHSISEQYPKGFKFTIETVIKLITELKTSNASTPQIISANTLDAIRMIEENGLNLAESVEFSNQLDRTTIREQAEYLLGVSNAVLKTLLQIRKLAKQGNVHSTVKPKKLMSYLIKLITPPNGIVLDPFMGSGSTGIAAKECGFDFIGIEKEQEYFEIAKARIG